MFVTFYSYKGGVGRSLALANVACLMAGDTEHPQRVLVWDFDLEAPGLHRLFPPKQPQNYGFVDLVYEYATTGNIPAIEDYIYESEIKGVHVLPAGKMGAEYCHKLQRINWVEFFGSDPMDPGPFFDNLLKRIQHTTNPFDYVLIDSRTGLNDQAGICTQVLSNLLIVLFRLTAQNLDGLEHLVPAIRSQLKRRGKKNTQILPIASQVRVASSEDQSLIRKKTLKLFKRELEYIRFDEDLVSKEKLFCIPDEIETIWPCPPIVDDYRRICDGIREQNKDDTKTQARELNQKMAEGDIATASTLLLRLLPRKPRLHQAWRTMSEIFDYRMQSPRKKEFKKTVSKIIRKDPENFFAHQWIAAFQISKVDRPESTELKKSINSLKKAVKFAPDSERGSIYRALGSIESAQGNHDNAINFLRKAQDLLPQNNQVNLDLAKLHMRIGAKYFALAAEELDEIKPDIGFEKYTSLAYIRTFLNEPEKASEAFSACDKSMKMLIKAHMLLIEGKRNESIEFAQKQVSSTKDNSDLANWAEFFICAEDFDKAISIANRAKKQIDDFKRIKNLAKFLSKKNSISSNQVDDLATSWGETSWSFIELIMFRECCIRDRKDYGKALDIIEKLVQFQEVDEINSRLLGLFTGSPSFRRSSISFNMTM